MCECEQKYWSLSWIHWSYASNSLNGFMHSTFSQGSPHLGSVQWVAAHPKRALSHQVENVFFIENIIFTLALLCELHYLITRKKNTQNDPYTPSPPSPKRDCDSYGNPMRWVVLVPWVSFVGGVGECSSQWEWRHAAHLAFWLADSTGLYNWQAGRETHYTPSCTLHTELSILSISLINLLFPFSGNVLTFSSKVYI